MRKFTILIWGIFAFSFTQINAQESGLFGSLYGQMDSIERQSFLGNLDSLLSGDFTDDSGELILGNLGNGIIDSGVIDSLNSLRDGSNPISDLDALTSEWGAGRDTLSGFLAGNGIDSTGQADLLGQFDITNSNWDMNTDSLGDIFDDYQDDLDPGSEVNIDGPPSPGIGNIFNDLNNSLDTTATSGLGGFSSVINDLFNSSLFTDLEIAYGRKKADVGYYGTGYSTGMESTQVVRIGSVPSFDKLWESRWSASASWTPEEFLTGGGDPTSTPTNEGGFSPLVFDFEFASMYNPGFSFGNIAGARVITSLGMEMSTYAPAHIDPSLQRTANNVGYTTGFGPQVGTGFATRVGQVTSYAMGTFALGRVNGAGYDYQSMKFEAGTRFGDKINLRYSVGQQDWSLDANKRVNTRQQFTVGVLTSSLFK